MKKIIELYRSNIYGIIGTLAFHVILFSSFLLADIEIKGKTQKKSDNIYIDLSEIIPKEKPKETLKKEATSQSKHTPLTNRGSNRLSNKKATSSSRNNALDDAYEKEVEEALKLSESVSSNLAKKRIRIEDIKMPVETTKNQDPETIDNTIYTGESTIVYYLENRYHLRLPIPVYLTQDGGVVVVDIVVNREGKVIEAKSRKNDYIKNENTYLYAETAALKTVFNASDKAIKHQKGTIHYTFVAQ